MFAFEVYQDKHNRWAWRLCMENGTVVAESQQPLSSRAQAMQQVWLVKTEVGSADIVDAHEDAEQKEKRDEPPV